MLKKFFIVLLLLISSSSAFAFWDEIGKCISDPCNCRQNDKTEVWNSGTVHEDRRTFKPGSVCPPWGRGSGRDQDNCLLKPNDNDEPSYPGNFTPYHLNACAQATHSSTYFTPKIDIRIQSCNIGACWHQSKTLNWDGQCVVWPTAYAIPVKRICARIALPETPPPPSMPNAETTPADHGYTFGKHLNFVGYTEEDERIVGVDGKVITLEPPKLCAYSDPGLVNLVSDTGVHLDPMDWNFTTQPLHETSELSPIAIVLKFLVETLGGLNLPSLLASLLDMMGAEDSQILKVFKKAFEAIGSIFNFFPSLIIMVIEALGKLNNSVDSQIFGCVQLSLGPYPPPYCPTLNQISISPVINNICTKKMANDNNMYDQSSTVTPCVVSDVRNNIVNNAMRVSFNKLIPLCQGINPDLNTCVKLNNLPHPSAKNIHTLTAFKDIIKSCSVTPNALCAHTQIPIRCSVGANGCNQGVRVVYAQKMGNHVMPSDYFISDIPDCGTSGAESSTTCQEVWGVNIGEFVDVSVKYPIQQGQDLSSLQPIQRNFTLTDNNNKARNLLVSITNSSTNKQSPERICLLESSNLIGCIERANSAYKIFAYECGHQNINCPNNTYFTPQFIASIQVREGSSVIDETNTVVTPLSVAGNPTTTDIETIVKLAGYDFSSSVAFIPKSPPKDPVEDRYIAMPFSGPNSFNQMTIHGKYKDNAKPYNSNGTVNPNAVYLKYLEYINGKYAQGGTHACLMPKNFQRCSPMPPNPHIEEPKEKYINCVLARLITPDPAKPPTVSQEYQDRVNPLPSLGPILNEDQYYKVQYNGSNPTYDARVEEVRDKTFRELDLCVPIIEPVCRAIVDRLPQHGNAFWEETDIGDLREGKCGANWIVIDPNKPLKRYCLSNFDQKKIDWEPLAPGVGCRESTGLPIEVEDNFPPGTIRPETPYNPTTRIGDFILNKPPIICGTDKCFASGEGFIGAGLYSVTFTITIDAIMDDIEYFKILDLWYDDCVQVDINGTKLLSAPTDIASCNNDQGKALQAVVPPQAIDIKSHLRQGVNKIVFQLRVIGGGGLYYHMQYKMKR